MTPLDYTVLAAYVASGLGAFALMGVDKYRALRRRGRIAENTLLLWCGLLGGLGGWLGMLVFRHKIRDRRFFLTVPAMLLAQAGLLAAYLRYWR